MPVLFSQYFTYQALLTIQKSSVTGRIFPGDLRAGQVNSFTQDEPLPEMDYFPAPSWLSAIMRSVENSNVAE